MTKLLSKLRVTYKVNGKEYQIFHVDNFTQDIDLSLNEYRDDKLRVLYNTKLIADTVPIPPEPPLPDNYNAFGTLMLAKITGKRVAMEIGGDPAANGQRYNCNHKFINYIMQGYFKTGKGQAQIEMKTDGINHGSCNRSKYKMPDLLGCMWYEPHILINGTVNLGGEWWHPDNHDIAHVDFSKKVEGGIAEQWIGYAVKAFYNENGLRQIEEYCAKNPFDANGKPTNHWDLVLVAVERMDGKMFPTTYDGETIFPRRIEEIVKINKGLEAEIRMHRTKANHGQPGGTDMKDAWVYELEPIPAK